MITNALVNELELQGEKGISRIGTYHGSDPTANTTKKLVKDWSHLAVLKVPTQNFVDVNVLIASCDMVPQDVLEIKRDPLNKLAPRALRTAFA
ncbi:hypothetical protein OUZ56_018457 [Daphnia magna]|uniref:GMP synthase n=1 Tax=Daphnia magna TaxID=35525 RepID=A0ABQ9ZA08_9CRUS|nr:hypothetical protein OUZ56_018457 [Daphnia magna]